MQNFRVVSLVKARLFEMHGEDDGTALMSMQNSREFRNRSLESLDNQFFCRVLHHYYKHLLHFSVSVYQSVNPIAVRAQWLNAKLVTHFTIDASRDPLVV